MTKQLYILFSLIAFACGREKSCSNLNTIHQLGSINLTLPACYDFNQPDTANSNLLWISKNDTMKFILELDRCIASSLDSLNSNGDFIIEQDTIENRYLLTTAIRSNFSELYQGERNIKKPYSFENQPFWFSVNDLSRINTNDTIFIKALDSLYIPMINLEHNCILIGYTSDHFKIVRPRFIEIENLIQSLKKARINNQIE